MHAFVPVSPRTHTHFIEIVEPQPDQCSGPLPPEGNVKLQNYRLLNENLRAYTPTGDIHTSPQKGKLVSRFDICATISPPRAKILELLRPEDPGRDALEAIIKPAPRRGLTRPLDEDTRRFLQRALLSPSPQNLSMNPTPEPHAETINRHSDEEFEVKKTEESASVVNQNCSAERSLADELREAEEDERTGRNIRKELLREFWKRGGGVKEAFERERMGKLALSVEEDEEYQDTGLSAAARRLDALLAESRDLHEELAGIQEDIQVLTRRVARRNP
ncbi:uncharacterized protein LOC128673504 isoform X2 [Plodia interpunctella]|uniref:uncharacterized protein LOC128673504 isoform X2 n=1 Tax=Plodia interpunctella TaxID=58824 RepID=UPI00236892CF|nr:uncharacterized protein LOC128673504 isoform X2 [Plodia interpunctella]XP_053607391.1 uncharacterized protein LOC128673504 isoform X2 [Plodia interpunctella]